MHFPHLLVFAFALYWHFVELWIRQLTSGRAAGRAVGFLHAVFAMYILCAPGDTTTPVMVQLSISTGYFAWEFSAAVRRAARGHVDAEKFAHALICGGGYLAVMHQGAHSSMIDYAVGFLWLEASTPFMHASWALNRWIPGSALHIACSLCFVATFVSSRLIYGAWLAHKAFTEFDFYRSPEETVCLTLVAASLVLNLYWMWRIVRMVNRSVKRD
jgi:hypothetical protein